MSGVAEENDSAFMPMPHRIAVHHRTAPAKVHHGVQGTHRRMSVAVNLLELGAMGCNVGFFGVVWSPIYRNDVELTAVAQRIMDDVVSRPGPQHDTIARDINLQVLHRNDGPQRR